MANTELRVTISDKSSTLCVFYFSVTFSSTLEPSVDMSLLNKYILDSKVYNIPWLMGIR